VCVLIKRFLFFYLALGTKKKMEITTVVKQIILVLVVYFLMKGLIKNYVGTNQRFYEPYSIFPELKALSEHFSTIEQEIKNAEWFGWPEKHLWTKPTDNWQVCPLFGFGMWHKLNVAKFPVTSALLKKIPGLRTAVFSRLGKGTKLTPHQGWAKLANEVLRCHMGILVPTDGASGVEVEGEFKQIELGKWFVFDDSKWHTGLNDSKTSDRIVLLLDIDRPWWVKRGESTYTDMEKLDTFLMEMQQYKE
jgi:aspartyl/asparaginyl beta-hydroxylase (cupin superfamily)